MHSKIKSWNPFEDTLREKHFEFQIECRYDPTIVTNLFERNGISVSIRASPTHGDGVKGKAAGVENGCEEEEFARSPDENWNRPPSSEAHRIGRQELRAASKFLHQWRREGSLTFLKPCQGSEEVGF